jgi:hypothetical protein
VRWFLDRGRVPAAAVVVLVLLMAPAGARAAAGTFYARGGGGNGGATCALGDECSLPTAVKKAETAGKGSEVVLMTGPNFTPNAELEVKGEVTLAGEAGAPRPTIEGHDGVEVAVALKGNSRIHDVNVVAGTNSAALRLQDSGGDRVTATTGSLGKAACEFEEVATLSNSVCFSSLGDGLEAFGFFEAVYNVDAIGAGAGILVAAEAPPKNVFEAWDTIAEGGPDSGDVVAETPNTEKVAEIIMHASAYDSVEKGAHPGKATITAPGAEGGITAPPQFANAIAGDFHQLLTSPTVDAGQPYEKEAALDLDRNPRSLTAHPVCGGPTAGPTDIGAYELVPPAPDCSAPPTPPAPDQPIQPNQPLVLEAYMKHQKIDSAKGTATFTFGGAGSFVGFQCELVRPAPKPAKPAAKSSKAKRKAPTFTACGSPRTYRHLVPGAYTFKVRPVTADGVEGRPVSRKFTIKAPQPKEQR